MQFWLSDLAQFDASLPGVTVDGRYGAATERAVRAFQQKATPDGGRSRRADDMEGAVRRVGRRAERPWRHGVAGDGAAARRYRDGGAARPVLAAAGSGQLHRAAYRDGGRQVRRGYSQCRAGVPDIVRADERRRSRAQHMEQAEGGRSRCGEPHRRAERRAGAVHRHDPRGQQRHSRACGAVLPAAAGGLLQRRTDRGGGRQVRRSDDPRRQSVAGARRADRRRRRRAADIPDLYDAALALDTSGPVVRTVSLPTPDKALRPGDTGAEVLRLNQMLLFLSQWIPEINFTTDSAASAFNPELETAVRSAQRYFGLSETGIVTAADWLTFRDAAEQLLAASPAGASPEPGGVWPAGALALGSAGAAVLQVQKWLNAVAAADQTADFVPETGQFDAATQAALESYQLTAGLEPLGVVDADTWESLRLAAQSLCRECQEG